MTLTPESELELLHQDAADARERLALLERAPHEGRWCGGKTEWFDRCANLEQRIRRLGELIVERETEIADQEEAAA